MPLRPTLLALFALFLSAALCRAVAPVGPEKLYPFLPEAPEGWFAESPSGGSTDGETAITVAGRNYFPNGDAEALAAPTPAPAEEPAATPAPEGRPGQAEQPESPDASEPPPPEPETPSASINIADAPDNPEFFESATAGWETVPEDASGYARPLEIAGQRGFETHDKERGVTTAVVAVNGRFLVTVEIVGLPPGDLASWLARVDFAKLAQIK